MNTITGGISDGSEAGAKSNTLGKGPPMSVAKPGVILKRFEAVMTKILLQNSEAFAGELPQYLKLPPLTDAGTLKPKTWPFDILPPAASICGKRNRVWKKEAQIRSMIQCVLNMLPRGKESSCDRHSCACTSDNSIKSKRRMKIVDFGGGSGHLALPLALLLPQCEVVIVDLKASSLELAHRRAKLVHSELKQNKIGKGINHSEYNDKMVKDLHIGRRGRKLLDVAADKADYRNIHVVCEGVPNLKTFHGDIRSYTDSFDLGLALHACGEATDLAMDQCVKGGAAFLAAPCCVGKLSKEKSNPYTFQATQSNISSISYPRSDFFRTTMGISDIEFNALASAGDYGESVDMGTWKGSSRRAAKTIIESDRILWAKQMGYETSLTRMQPWAASPKNDIIVGWKRREDRCPCYSFGSPFHSGDLCRLCDDSNADMDLASKHLIGLNNPTSISSMSTDNPCSTASEWSVLEEDEVSQTLRIFVADEKKKEYKFPRGEGPRRRKLIHHLAETMGLRHQSIGGKSNKERSVLVSKRQRPDNDYNS